MHLSLIWRRHWRLVVAAGAPAAGFLLAAPAAALVIVAAGVALLGAARVRRPGPARADEGRGAFGYLELLPPASPGGE